jgi:hypothetical protein
VGYFLHYRRLLQYYCSTVCVCADWGGLVSVLCNTSTVAQHGAPYPLATVWDMEHSVWAIMPRMMVQAYLLHVVGGVIASMPSAS